MRPHRLHAACYDRMTAPLERQVLQLRAATEVVAAEPDAAMRRQLARRVVDAPVPVEVSDTTAEALPFPDRRFDAVLLTLVLCTVTDPQPALAEAHRVLKPAGTLVVIEHVRGTGGLARWQDTITPLWRRIAAGCHPNRDIRSAVQRAGFRWTSLEEFQPMPAWIPVSPMLQGIAVKGPVP